MPGKIKCLEYATALIVFQTPLGRTVYQPFTTKNIGRFKWNIPITRANTKNITNIDHLNIHEIFKHDLTGQFIILTPINLLIHVFYNTLTLFIKIINEYPF